MVDKPTYDFVKSCRPEIYNKSIVSKKTLLGFTSLPPFNYSLRQKTIIDANTLPDTLDEFERKLTC